MVVSEIEHDGVRATIDFRNDSYLATLRWSGNNCVLVVKSFGNGITAEDWILQELKLPTSLLYLKYS